MISAPTFQIQCDEPNCHNSATMLLLPDTWWPFGWYQLTQIAERYRKLGGHTFPDGKHCCATCWHEVAAAMDKRNRKADYLDALL